MNYKELIITKLKTMNHKIVDTGYPYIMTNCLSPTHKDKKPSFHINYQTGFGKCFGCGYKIDKTYWIDGKIDEEMILELERQATYNEITDQLTINNPKITPIDLNLIPPFGSKVPEGWRGFTKKTIDYFGLYTCKVGKYKDRIIIPIKDEAGTILAFNTRTLINEEPKYLYNFGFDAKNTVFPLLKPTSYVLVTEGMLDSMSLTQMGIPNICNFGVANNFGKLKIKELLKKGVNTLYLSFDKDEAGEEGMENMMESSLTEVFEVKLAKFHCKELIPYYISSCKDFNEYLQTISLNT